MPHQRARWRHLARGANGTLRMHPYGDLMELAIEPVYKLQRTESPNVHYGLEFPGMVTATVAQPPVQTVETVKPHPYYANAWIRGTTTISYALSQTTATVEDRPHYAPIYQTAEPLNLDAAVPCVITEVFDGAIYYVDGTVEPLHTTTTRNASIGVTRQLDTDAMEGPWWETGTLIFKYEGGSMSPEPQVVEVQGEPIVTKEYVAVDDADDFPRSDYYPRIRKGA